MYSICLPCHFLICITVNHILCINIPIRFSFHYNIILIINLKKQVASFSVLIISSWNRFHISGGWSPRISFCGWRLIFIFSHSSKSISVANVNRLKPSQSHFHWCLKVKPVRVIDAVGAVSHSAYKYYSVRTRFDKNRWINHLQHRTRVCIACICLFPFHSAKPFLSFVFFFSTT